MIAYKVTGEGTSPYGVACLHHQVFAPKGFYLIESENRVAWDDLPESITSELSEADSWGNSVLELTPIQQCMDRVFSSAVKEYLLGVTVGGILAVTMPYAANWFKYIWDILKTTFPIIF